MRLTYTSPHKSIRGLLTEETLPEFVVLTGRNGSGKSSLLEAITQGHMSVEGLAGPQEVRIYGLGALVATNTGSQTPAAYKDRWLQTYTRVQGHQDLLLQPQFGLTQGSDDLETRVRSEVVANQLITEKAVLHLLSGAKKDRVTDLTQDDFRRYGPSAGVVQDAFQQQVLDIFLSYHQRWNDNRFARFNFSDGTSIYPGLTENEFRDYFGPKPWDLVNETLRAVGLDYEYPAPAGSEENLPYEARLRDLETGTLVATDQLSSGEKTLLALALALYGGTHGSEMTTFPKLLLLDETDASLHPAMIQRMLNVIDEVIVQRHGVKVILTTHSPTTVALASEDSLYAIHRSSTPRLTKVSRDKALSILTVGIPTLAISIDKRRQVFVESEKDEQLYTDLYRLTEDKLQSDVSLEFIASGHGGQGGESQVRRIVAMLREAGNTTVWGIVDRDNRTAAPEFVIFTAERYAIENLLLDPLLIGILLLREGHYRAPKVGLPEHTLHGDVNDVNAQMIIDAVCAAVAKEGDDLSPVAANYAGQWSGSVPSFYFNMNGKALKARLIDAYPALQPRKDYLMTDIVSKVIADHPRYLPQPVRDVMMTIKAA